MQVGIELAASAEQYAAGKNLFRAYAEFLGLDLEFQGFSAELDGLREMYGPPRGCLLLAKLGPDYVGAVGLREFAPGFAEMKRLFVLPQHQGLGVGIALIEAFIAQARRLDYRAIWLDSIRPLDKALNLYRKFGFLEIEAYRHNPHPEAVFMELTLRCA